MYPHGENVSQHSEVKKITHPLQDPIQMIKCTTWSFNAEL